MSSKADFTPERGTYKDLTPFRYWCQKVLPLVYDDALSYYELLSKVLDYLNKTMEDVNTLHEDVDNLFDAYELLQTWVNDYTENYFEGEGFIRDLDAALDRMVASGEFGNIVNEKVASQINAVVASQISGTVAGQLPNVVSNQIGGTVAGQLPGVVNNQLPPIAQGWLNAHVTSDSTLLDDSFGPYPTQDVNSYNKAPISELTGRLFDRILSSVDIANLPRLKTANIVNGTMFVEPINVDDDGNNYYCQYTAYKKGKILEYKYFDSSPVEVKACVIPHYIGLTDNLIPPLTTGSGETISKVDFANQIAGFSLNSLLTYLNPLKSNSTVECTITIDIENINNANIDLSVFKLVLVKPVYTDNTWVSGEVEIGNIVFESETLSTHNVGHVQATLGELYEIITYNNNSYMGIHSGLAIKIADSRNITVGSRVFKAISGILGKDGDDVTISIEAKMLSEEANDITNLKEDFHDVVGATPAWQSKLYLANNSAITNISVSADGTSIAFDIGSSANNIGVYSATMFYTGKTYVIAFDISASVSDKVKLSTKYGLVDFVGSTQCFFVYTPSANASNSIYTSGANPLCRISITNFRVYEFTNQAEPSLMPTVVNIKNHVGQMDESIAKVDSLTEGIPYVYPENWLDMSNISLNTYISSSGATHSGPGVFTTDYFIPVKNGDVITLTQLRTDGLFYHGAINIYRIGLYDAQKAPIGASPNYVNDYTISNENCKYIKICLDDAYNGGVTVLAEISINCIPTKASMTEYVAPHYDSFGVSDSIKRNRRVLWLGTSIPTYGYPQILARTCGCIMHNEAIGSSGITKGIPSLITTANVCGITSIYGLYGLTQTVAEKQTMINNWSTIAAEIGSSATLTDKIKNIALASSYETIVDPYLTGDNAVDLIVINHAYNDNTENAIAPENDKLNPHYLEGAYNWLIKRILEANPNIGIVIFGHYSDLPTSKETALQNVADRWNIPYYLLKNELEWSSTQTITTTKKINSSGEWETISATDMTVQAMWLGDGVHPLGVASKRIAQVAQNVFANWLKMYCDDVN